MQVIERRIGLLFAVFLAALAIGATKAAWLGVVKAGTLQRAAIGQQEADITIPARRGSITDANGIDLAVSEPAMDIAATPRLVTDPTKAASKIAPLIGKPEDYILRQLARRDTGFVYLNRGVPAGDADKIKKLNIAGLEFIPRYRREYPRDFMASQLLGSVGTDGNGLSGLEYDFESKLSGSDGERQLVKDAMGQPIKMRDIKPVQSGHSIKLTLDANLQTQTETVLGEVGEMWKPKGATAIVMDPNSGAILALASWPRVNANAPGDAPETARMNRAIGINYEPGSTFKAITVAAALEDGKVTPDTHFAIPPSLMVADREIKDAEAHGYRQLHDRRHPQVLLEHRRGADREEARREPSRSTPGSAASASASRPASTSRARSAARCCRCRSTRARRWATCRSGRASRSRRCRWSRRIPRSPTAGSCARRTSWRRSAARRPRNRPASA